MPDRMYPVGRYVSELQKCGSCNWEVANVYLLASCQEEADDIYKETEKGLCGDCLCEMLIEGSDILGYDYGIIQIERNPVDPTWL